MTLGPWFFGQSDVDWQAYEMADELADRFAQTAAEYDRTGTFPFAHFEAMRERGYLALTVPREDGGLGAGVHAMVFAQERLARGDGSTALAVGWHLYVVGKQATSRTWPEPVRRRLFDEVVADGALLNACASEPETGSPSRGGLPRTTARRLPDGSWVLTGRKNFTTLAPVLRYFLVSATLAGTEEAAWFLVPRESPGLRVEETWDSLAMRATGSHDLWLDEVHLPADALLESGQDRSGARTEGWLLHVPAVYLGVAQAARDFAVQYAVARRTVNPPGHPEPTARLADRPHVQRLIGEMDLALLPARHLLMGLARQWDERPDWRPHLVDAVAACKPFVVETALGVVDRAMRAAGGASLSRSLPLERFYRDARAGLHNPPMEDVVLSALARSAIARAQADGNTHPKTDHQP